jgi:hypothetical protein
MLQCGASGQICLVINMKQISEVEKKPFTFSLKVPKCEIFDRSDFHDFYSIKPFWVGDFGAKILL